MDLVSRRRRSTLEFFQAIEAFGLRPVPDHTNAGKQSRLASKVKRRKGWPVYKVMHQRALGSAVMRSPTLLIAHVGTPLNIASCISYSPYEVERRMLFKEEDASAGKHVDHPGLNDVGKSKKSESFKHLLVIKSSSDSSASSTDSDLSSFSSVSSLSSPEKSHQLPERYDPLYLDDPELTTGRHRTVVSLSGFISSIIHYAGEDEIKCELNDRFRQIHPYLDQSITLSKIRNLKSSLLKAALAAELELIAAAISYTLLEKLIISGHVIKSNRRICGACCLLLAAKICDYKELEIKLLLQSLSATFEIPVSDILKAEFSVFAALRFCIQVPQYEYLAHFERIISDLDYCNFQEYLGERMHSLWIKDASE